ncbi:hypothetical protein Acsp04_39680 [Actinomadura sp. NBRC 104425]|nr:hypothetical protein [Actinomadura sp. NBRC 104425]GLZ13733.1 hypothetical protein Acsp04_39680 [Actinomadura sp. NBRC 104425]
MLTFAIVLVAAVGFGLPAGAAVLVVADRRRPRYVGRHRSPF